MFPNCGNCENARWLEVKLNILYRERDANEADLGRDSSLVSASWRDQEIREADERSRLVAGRKSLLAAADLAARI